MNKKELQEELWSCIEQMDKLEKVRKNYRKVSDLLCKENKNE